MVEPQRKVHRQLRRMATSRQNLACAAGSCRPLSILTATVCTPPSTALYTCNEWEVMLSSLCRNLMTAHLCLEAHLQAQTS